MGEQWTAERVLSLAPDASSAKAGKELSSPRKWQNLGHSETAAWGECQGSGAKPYQTQIDLSEPAFKCSCPSRKFPCKHGLGLFLMLAEKPELLQAVEPPGWVKQWIASRTQRTEKKTAKQQETAEKPSDPEAQAKRIAEREKKITAGLEQLAVWLNDVIGRGLAAIQSEGYAPWEQMAARMVDAQASGVARLLREAAEATNSGEGWQQRLLVRLARIHLLLEGYKRLTSLPEPLQMEIRTLVGWTQPTEEVLAGEGVRDSWCVVGQRVETEDRLRVQRTWLWGTKLRRPAMLLQFAHGGAPFASTVVPGTELDATLVYYAGAYPMRAIIKDRNGTTVPVSRVTGCARISEALGAYAAALAKSPWVELFPMALEAVSVHRLDERWVLRDAEGQTVPIASRFPRPRSWQMLAQSGGHPVGIFGEWDGEELLPLGLSVDGHFSIMVKE